MKLHFTIHGCIVASLPCVLFIQLIFCLKRPSWHSLCHISGWWAPQAENFCSLLLMRDFEITMQKASKQASANSSLLSGIRPSLIVATRVPWLAKRAPSLPPHQRSILTSKAWLGHPQCIVKSASKNALHGFTSQCLLAAVLCQGALIPLLLTGIYL